MSEQQNSECPICYESKKLITPKCQHAVCVECTSRNLYQYQNQTCCLCRAFINYKDLSESDQTRMSDGLKTVFMDNKDLIFLHTLNYNLHISGWMTTWMDDALLDLQPDQADFKIPIIAKSIRLLSIRIRVMRPV